ncbi:hypothetical protein [Hydrogenophaga sp.]|uniref:hypothetical protein n=1 Tax=Hydrogenophaga sp. TaxID=1904254 RepID=UPI00262D0A59|nr:hypothetical protein [Hydrogenophaga sp.]MCW5654043.1 hypothetical protein [Hydrogenophaga sp.]
MSSFEIFVVVVVTATACFGMMSYVLERFFYKRPVTAQEVRAGFIYLLLLVAIAFAIFEMLKRVLVG